MSANPATLWTPEEIAELTRLHAQRDPALSYTEIAAQLPGRDRNACIGKAHRLKLPDRSEMRNHGRPAKPSTAGVKRRRGPVSPTRIKDARSRAAKPGEPPDRVVLLNAADGCQWPCGDHPFVFCGCEVKKGLPYCDEHAALAYKPRRAA